MKEIYKIFTLFLSFSSISCSLYNLALRQNVISVKNFIFWPNATVPFYINPEHFDHQQSLLILTTLSRFAFKTCMKFAPVMALPNSNEHVLVFVNPTGIKRCAYDSKGHSALGPHLLTLGYDCLKTPNLEMAIMKSLGFPFEHNRANRDEHITIMMENIEPGAVEFFNKDTNEPVEFRLLPYDVNSVMHFGNREFSKNGHKTIIFKDVSYQQNRIGLTTNDIRKFDIVYGRECLKRDRQERIDICQSYPNVARRKRDTSNVNDQNSDKNDHNNDKKDQNSDKNDLNNNKNDQNSDKNDKTDANKDKNDAVNFRSDKTKDVQVKNSDLNNKTNINNTVDNRPATVSINDTKGATKSLRVNPNITPPPNLNIPHNLHDLGIEEQVQTIVEDIYKVSATALENSRQKYCKATEKISLRAGNEPAKANDVLGIINLISDYAQDMVDNAMENLTRFCDDSESIVNYERARCSFQIGGDPRCTPSYRSTKSGMPVYSTQHRPIIMQSTKHWNRYRDHKYHVVRRSNVTARRSKTTKRDKVRKNGKTERKPTTKDERVRARREISSSTESSRAKRDISTPNESDNKTIQTEHISTATMATDKQDIVTEKRSFTSNVTNVEDTESTTGKSLDKTKSSDIKVKKIDKGDLRMGTGIPSQFGNRNNRRGDYRSFMKSRAKDNSETDVSNEKNTKIKNTSVKKVKYMPSEKRETQLEIMANKPTRRSYDKQETEIPKYHEISFHKQTKDLINRQLHEISLDTKKVPNTMNVPLEKLQDDNNLKTNPETRDTDILNGKHKMSIYKHAKILLDNGTKIQNRKDEFSLEEEIQKHNKSYHGQDHPMRGDNSYTPYRPSPIIRPKRKYYHGAESFQRQPKQPVDVEEIIEKARRLSFKSNKFDIHDVLESSTSRSRFRVVSPESDDEIITPKVERIPIHKLNTFKKPVVENWKNRKEDKNIYAESSEDRGSENREMQRGREFDRERSKRDRELEQDRNRDRERKQDLEQNRNRERNRDRESERDRNRDRDSEQDLKNEESSEDRDRDRDRESDISNERDHIQDHDRALKQYKQDQGQEQQDRNIRDRVRERGRPSKQDRELDRDRERDSRMPESYKEKPDEQRSGTNKKQNYKDNERQSKKREDPNEVGPMPPTIALSKLNKEFYRERRWPNGVVRYMIKPGLKYDYDDIHARLGEVNDILKKRTCVRIEEITEAQAEQFEDYIYIDDSPDYVTGRVGGKQNFGAIELLEGGQHRQHAAMMVMAMLGFYFEVARHDRDSHIRVHQRHVRPDKLHHFEKIREDATLAVPYDYASATHPAWQFWRQFGVSGISTVATFKQNDPDGIVMKSLGQNRELLSDIDILKINSVYGVRCFMRKNNKRDSHSGPKIRSRSRYL